MRCMAGHLHAHFQPIVNLATGEVVAYEALARDEQGRFPAEAFAAARAAGALDRLDRECQEAALRDAAGLRWPATLFVNVEPECFDGPDDLEAPDCAVIVEVTERGLTHRPAELLLAVERVRARGWGVAVDDVGVDWRSLALLPFLRPDVVKLDRSVLAEATSPAAARAVRGAKAHLERHGGLLLAEGVEDAGHERRAIALGATLAQGWHYGHPAPLPPTTALTSRSPVARLVAPHSPIGDLTPFQVVRTHGIPLGVATKAELLPLSLDLEEEAEATRYPSVVLATFQDAQRFTPSVAERYKRLAAGAAFVGAFGVGMSPEPAPGVRGASLASGEALRDEWCVIVVGPHSALALIARDVGDGGADADRRFEYVLTEDRALVMHAARALMLRVVAEPVPRPAIRADLASV